MTLDNHRGAPWSYSYLSNKAWELDLQNDPAQPLQFKGSASGKVRKDSPHPYSIHWASAQLFS